MIERLKRILQSAIGDLIERASDPELELVRFVEEIEIALGEVRAEIEETSLRKARIAEQCASQQATAENWMRQAEQAVEDGDDASARKYLVGRREAEGEVATCERRLEELSAALQSLGRDRDALERKLHSARLEQKRLSAELRRAESEQRSGTALSGGESMTASVDRVREEIHETQATGEAIHAVKGASVEAEFQELEENASVEQELAALKERMKKEPQDGAK